MRKLKVSKTLYHFYIAILVFTFFYCISKSAPLLNVISSLIYCEGVLGKCYVERLDFKLAEDSEQIRKGMSEKYVLKGQDGSKWLFKGITCDWMDNSFRAREMHTVLAYKLARILGVNTPEMYEFHMSTNGLNKSGYIQKMIPLAGKSISPHRFTGKKKDKFFLSIATSEIFSWLLYGNEGMQLLLSSSGEIYQIDLQNSFCDLTNNPALFSINERKWLKAFYEIDASFVDLGWHGFLKHVAGIPDDWLIKHSNPIIADEYGERQDVKTSVNLLIRRKEILTAFLSNKYPLHSNFKNKKFISNSGFLYRLNLCKKLCKSIFRTSKDLLFLKKHVNKKNNFVLICSGEAWILLREHFKFLRKTPGPSAQELDKRCLDAEKKLMLLRRNCNVPEEKLAITLYLRQVKTFKRYMEKYFEKELDNEVIFLNFQVEIFIQIIHNLRTFKHPETADRWFSLINYQKAGDLAIVKSAGEDEYIAGMMKLINKQYNEAAYFFKSAQEKGYAVDEIEEIIKTYLASE